MHLDLVMSSRSAKSATKFRMADEGKNLTKVRGKFIVISL